MKPLSPTPVPRQKWDEIQAILDTSNDIPGDLVARLETYIHNDPQSPFAPDIKLRLGEYYKNTGRYTRAYNHFLETWEILKNNPLPDAVPMADRALSQATYFLASMGRTDQAAEFLEANENRQFRKMHDYYWWERAANKVGVQQSHPERAFRCGIFAINAVARALDLVYNEDLLLRTNGKINGFSLNELIPVAEQIGLELTAVIDKNHLDIPVPSIVHLALEHYAAITEFRDGFYKVEDPTNGGIKWLTQREINDEATGYFLIPTSLVDSSWKRVDKSEGAMVIGRGSACPPNDDEDGGGECPDCGCAGMPQWSVSEPYLNLWMKDTPITYSPSKGPGITITLSHRQRNPLNPDSKTLFGSGWHASIVSYIDDFEHKTVFPGGQRTKAWTLGTRSFFKNEVVTQLTGPGGYLVTYPDGSSMKYTYQTTNWQGFVSYQITEYSDQNGHKLIYSYDNNDRLQTIVDADGGITSISYWSSINSSNNYVYRITTPDGRYAQFNYNSSNGNLN